MYLLMYLIWFILIYLFYGDMSYYNEYYLFYSHALSAMYKLNGSTRFQHDPLSPDSNTDFFVRICVVLTGHVQYY